MINDSKDIELFRGKKPTISKQWNDGAEVAIKTWEIEHGQNLLGLSMQHLLVSLRLRLHLRFLDMMFPQRC